MNRFIRLATAGAVLGLSGIGLSGALAPASAYSACTSPTVPDDFVSVCVNSTPAYIPVGTASVAASVDLKVFADPYPVCVGRVTVNATSGTPVVYDPRLVYRCY